MSNLVRIAHAYDATVLRCYDECSLRQPTLYAQWNDSAEKSAANQFWPTLTYG